MAVKGAVFDVSAGKGNVSSSRNLLHALSLLALKYAKTWLLPPLSMGCIWYCSPVPLNGAKLQYQPMNKDGTVSGRMQPGFFILVQPARNLWLDHNHNFCCYSAKLCKSANLSVSV